MELIKNFGINPLLLAAQIVNFLIILFILKRFLYKPLFDMLKSREKTIKEGLEKAQEAAVTLENAKQKETEVLKNAQKEAKKIIDEAKIQSQTLARQIEETAKKNTEKMIAEAKEEIIRDAKESEIKIMRNVSLLAIQFLQKSLPELVSKKAQQEIMAKALKQVWKKPN